MFSHYQRTVYPDCEHGDELDDAASAEEQEFQLGGQKKSVLPVMVLQRRFRSVEAWI